MQPHHFDSQFYDFVILSEAKDLLSRPRLTSGAQPSQIMSLLLLSGVHIWGERSVKRVLGY
jgi:hypothetical protein